MRIDCAIVGGGPAGLNAALVLARAGRNIIVFDDNRPRNAVTGHVHGFLTRDGVSPSQFRGYAIRDISRYPHAMLRNETVIEARSVKGGFRLLNAAGKTYQARKLIIATGLKERLPTVPGIENFYGNSLFSCPYCDGWELSDMPLVVIAENAIGLQTLKLAYQWSKDLVWCTNGHVPLSPDQQYKLEQKRVRVLQGRIAKLEGEAGQLRAVVFEDGSRLSRRGGFVSTYWRSGSTIAERLGCDRNEQGGIGTDKQGRTSVYGVYAAGDATAASPPQAVIAAGEGVKAAMGVNADLIAEEWA